jgi:hypothetical protein
MDKYGHVRARIREGVTGKHKCHWPGCEKLVVPAQWGCTQHWYTLPRDIRHKIWHAYRVSQEDDKVASAEYIEAAREAREWIKRAYG